MSGYTTNGLTSVTLPFTGNEKLALDTQLASGISPQSEASSLTQLATYFGGNLPWVTGRFYGLPLGVTPVAVLTVASTLYAYPIYIPNTVTISTLNISVTTGQTGGACHIGLYKDNGSGYPSTLVFDSGAISGLTSTTVVTSTLSPTQTVNAGWYWVASIFTASATMPSVIGSTSNYASSINARLGSNSAANALATSGEAATGISVSGTYGSLPSTFTTGATLTLNAATPLFALGV